MCNDAIRVVLGHERETGEKVRSRFKLQELAYPRLKEYGLHTHYILSACEVAYSVYQNKNRKSDPYIKRGFIKLDNESYTLDHLILRIPTKPREFIYLTLQASDYHLSFVDDPSLKRGSITLTGRILSIAFSKETAEIEPHGQIGIDVNERNVTWSDSTPQTEQVDTSDVAEIKERYRENRAKIAQKTKRDRRIQQKLLAKCGRRERNRTIQKLHKISIAIVNHAKDKGFGIKMERLTGIRKLYRKGNGQGRSFRGRMNSWMFHEVQRQIEYKARWEGIPVTYVNPRGTSRNCPDCGSRVVPLADRKLFCPECDKTWDRDVLASKNVMACVVPQARPPRGSRDGEPQTQEDVGNHLSRWMEVGSVPKSQQNPRIRRAGPTLT